MGNGKCEEIKGREMRGDVREWRGDDHTYFPFQTLAAIHTSDNANTSIWETSVNESFG